MILTRVNQYYQLTKIAANIKIFLRIFKNELILLNNGHSYLEAWSLGLSSMMFCGK
jgi:hypothetical protein